MKKDDEVEQMVGEINQHIRKGLNDWADITLEAEVKEFAFMLNYSPIDLMNAAYLFQHVASNIGIKKRIINEENVSEFGNRFRQLIKDMTGCDPHDILNGTKMKDAFLN